jgi:hypothetical protein
VDCGSHRVASLEAVQWADGSALESAVARVIVTIRDGKPVVLFSGHDSRELLWIAGLMRDAMGWDARGGDVPRTPAPVLSS